MECNRGSPILIDLANNSQAFHLTSAEDGVWFDLKAKGTPRRVAWTEPESKVAFLAMDRNGNGTIDDGSELFGTATRMNSNSCAPNGFIALAELDSNRDGKVDANDLAFSSLRLWTDTNHNGQSEPGELLTLSEEGVLAVFTTYSENRRRDKHGNWYRFEGTALVQNGQQVARRVYDVFLVMLLQ